MIRLAHFSGHTFVSSLVTPNGTVFDFGLNYGGFSKAVAPLCARVIGFEPDTRWEGRRPSLPANVTVVPKAVAVESGTYRFHQNKEDSSSLHFADAGGSAVDVEAMTLKQALALGPDRRIDLIKMDIEGAELAILRNADCELLARVAQMSVEFHDFLDPTQLPEIRHVIQRMRRFGFWVVKFGWRSYGDTLFVNARVLPLLLQQRIAIIVVYKYGRGLVRVLSRLRARAKKLFGPPLPIASDTRAASE